MQKVDVVQALGEQALLLPTLLAEALAANERLKLRLTLLQAADTSARQPGRPAPSFDAEQRAAGLSDAPYNTIVSKARKLSDGRILAPGAKPLMADLASDLAVMLAPLKAAGSPTWQGLDERLTAITAKLPAAEEDTLAPEDIHAMTSARHDGADSVHLLVMDAHKAVNLLASTTAVEKIDGASVYGIADDDRIAVKSFMAGINRTSVLAFGHPGLGTTATRTGTTLTIQNDIGTTDAHVLVIHVEEGLVRLTYTDVHRPRAKFFMSLFDGQGVDWHPLAEKDTSGALQAFWLVSGQFSAADQDGLCRFLEFAGSRIVFLIDWNKGRKALQIFVGKKSAVDILKWAANQDYGHRAFLELGGKDLVFETVRQTAADQIPYGARLDEALGAAESAHFLKRVLHLTSEGMRADRSARLIRDEIQADLAQLLDTAESEVLTVLVHHLGLSRMLAGAIADSFAGGGALSAADRSGLARSAKRMEEKADRLTVLARDMCARMQRGEHLRQTVDEVENATDALDECAFLLSLVPQADGLSTIAGLVRLGEIAIESIGHLVRATEAASLLPQDQRADAAESLQAIDAVINAERAADMAERDAFSAFMQTPCTDARSLLLGLEITRSLETATDHLAHAALSLRDRVLEELSA